MKKVVNIFGKIILIICIILIIGYIISFIVGILDSYNNGVTKTFLFGGSLLGTNNDTVYGREAINLFLSQSYFDFGIISMLGILPSICIPIFVAILLKFKKSFTKKVIKYMIIALIICIILHIIAFNDFIKYGMQLIVLPYIESIIISYLIARVIFKLSSEK